MGFENKIEANESVRWSSHQGAGKAKKFGAEGHQEDESETLTRPS